MEKITGSIEIDIILERIYHVCVEFDTTFSVLIAAFLAPC